MSYQLQLQYYTYMNKEPNSNQIQVIESNTNDKPTNDKIIQPSSQSGVVLNFIKPESIYEHTSKSESDEHGLSYSQKYNVSLLKTSMLEDQQLDHADMLELIAKFKNIIRNEENMIRVNGDVIVVGDIHGQYYDFVKILSIISSKYGDLPSLLEKEHILFLGDFVDRGYYSIQVMTIVMALKVNFPNNVHCLRGNHQCRTMTSIYNFKAEVLVKYNQQIYQHFMEAFDLLPFACLINSCYFCAHGGISDKLLNISKINAIDRTREIPDDGPLCDFIWSDPVSKQKESIYQEIEFNNVRMCSIFFGQELTNKFQKINHVKSIIRAHEVFHEGYQRRDWDKKHPNIPSILTIFSAPNYCGIYGNYGAILHIKNNSFEIKQYKEQTLHYMSDQIDMINWSLPEILRVVNEFAKNMVQTLEQHYLKSFPDYSELPFNTKLNILLEYYYKYHKEERNHQSHKFESKKDQIQAEKEQPKLKTSVSERPKSPKDVIHDKIQKLNGEFLKHELQKVYLTRNGSRRVEKHNTFS